MLPSSSGTQRILNLEIAKARSPVTDAVSEPSKALSAPDILFFPKKIRRHSLPWPLGYSTALREVPRAASSLPEMGVGQRAWGEGAPRVPSPVRLAGLGSFSHALKNSSWPAPPSSACPRFLSPPPLGLPWQAQAVAQACQA